MREQWRRPVVVGRARPVAVYGTPHSGARGYHGAVAVQRQTADRRVHAFVGAAVEGRTARAEDTGAEEQLTTVGPIVGAGLSAIGVAVQAMVRNALADPYVLGISSGALGKDLDPSFNVGGGVKFYITHRFMMRLDVRDVVAARLKVDAGATNYPEVLLGFSLTLNRKKPAPATEKDSDGDGFLDSADSCPVEPGIAPDGCPERDRDGDGFMDSQDACPDVPGIAPDGCPEKDRDGDGFLDSVDKCPDDPGVEPDGCPIPDTDGDGILDPEDKCPTVPETKNGYQDEDGCPDEIPMQLAKFTGTIKGIYFDLDKDTIKPKSRPVLDRAVAVLNEFNTIRIEISGHTDSTGSVAYNKDLSGRRAASVKRYLVEHGVAEARIETRGAGPDEPVDTNKTAAGRAKNRRIEFTILVQ